MRTKGVTGGTGGTYGRYRKMGRGIYQLGAVLVALLCIAVLSACFDRVTGPSTTVVVGVDDHSGAGQPSPTPSDGVCAIGRLDAGVENDVTVIGQGDTVNGGVIAVGTQGVALTPTCAAQFTPVWTQPTPCVLSGTGYNISISAPSSVALDTVCTATVSVPNFSGTGSVSLRVVP